MFFLTDLPCTVKRHGSLLGHLASQASHRLTWELCLCWKQSSADVQTSNMPPWLIQWDATLDPSKQRGSDINDMLKSFLSRHTNCLLCRLSMCHLVNGSLVISQPSSMVPTKVVPHASPAISITDMIWVSTKQSVWTLRNLGMYSRIFMSVRKKLFKQPCTKNQKTYVIRDGFWQICTNWKPQSNDSKEDISISSAIWQVLLVSDSLRDSACVKGAHRHKFKHQMCCPWNLWNREHLIRMKYAAQIVCFRLRICHLVNGSLVIFQPSPVVPTKVVHHANPAISNTGPPVRSNARCDPANNITICPTAQKFGGYFGSFTSFRKRVNKFAQSIKRFDKKFS